MTVFCRLRQPAVLATNEITVLATAAIATECLPNAGMMGSGMEASRGHGSGSAC
jgi:hypothetical protein